MIPDEPVPMLKLFIASRMPTPNFWPTRVITRIAMMMIYGVHAFARLMLVLVSGFGTSVVDSQVLSHSLLSANVQTFFGTRMPRLVRKMDANSVTIAATRDTSSGPMKVAIRR
jgi:hypothetical protein